MPAKNDELDKLLHFLFQSWSIQSSSKWTEDNPAKGQCGVTALVVNDIFGGEILKTKLSGGWHFYNSIDGKRYDFTKSQFREEINYKDSRSNRDEAFLDTNQKQYTYLKQRVEELILVSQEEIN
ncbi:YunG family protein [Cytobacillus praedii]|uniref:YunG family protein n=1 Tax=Cytobacillus praedii TaxID=1742358 RepID=UPI003F7DF741